MTVELRFGDDRVMRLKALADGSLVAAAAPLVPLDDPAAAVREALSRPWEYPPLVDAIVPGDRIVVALGHDVPQAQRVLQGTVEALLQSRATADDVTILLPPVSDHGSGQSPEGAPIEVKSADVHVVHHEPGNSQQLAYLAASKENKPIYINRHLVDADVVLPIGCLRPRCAFGYHGFHGGLFPEFADQATRQRYLAPDSSLSQVQQQRRRKEADEAAWLLGLQLVVQVVPGPGDTVLQVLAGAGTTVAERGREFCERAWSYRIPRRVDLVVATISGVRRDQTWENLGRALALGLQAVEDGGAVLLCTELLCAPGPALQRLIPEGDVGEALRSIRRERSEDAVTASLLCEALERAHVYLLSGLDRQTVEDLGLGYVADAEDVQRLIEKFRSCLLLRDAHRAALTVCP